MLLAEAILATYFAPHGASALSAYASAPLGASVALTVFLSLGCALLATCISLTARAYTAFEHLPALRFVAIAAAALAACALGVSTVHALLHLSPTVYVRVVEVGAVTVASVFVGATRDDIASPATTVAIFALTAYAGQAWTRFGGAYYAIATITTLAVNAGYRLTRRDFFHGSDRSNIIINNLKVDQLAKMLTHLAAFIAIVTAFPLPALPTPLTSAAAWHAAVASAAVFGSVETLAGVRALALLSLATIPLHSKLLDPSCSLKLRLQYALFCAVPVCVLLARREDFNAAVAIAITSTGAVAQNATLTLKTMGLQISSSVFRWLSVATGALIAAHAAVHLAAFRGDFASSVFDVAVLFSGTALALVSLEMSSVKRMPKSEDAPPASADDDPLIRRREKKLY